MTCPKASYCENIGAETDAGFVGPPSSLMNTALTSKPGSIDWNSVLVRHKVVKKGKTMKTAEEIFAIAERKSDTALGQRRIINRIFRNQDQSQLWPVNSRFSIVDRAIRRINKIERSNGAFSNLEYALAIETEESKIVNKSY